MLPKNATAPHKKNWFSGEQGIDDLIPIKHTWRDKGMVHMNIQ